MIRSALLLAAIVAPAHAGTVAVVTEASEGPLPGSTFQSVMWHALYQEFGHDAVFLPELNASAVQALQATTMTTLLHARLTWKTDSVQIQLPDQPSYFIGGYFPSIETTEYTLQGDQLIAQRTWRTEGPVSVYRVRNADERAYISLPEISLQETAAHAVQPLQAPVWTAERDWLLLPVVLAADEEYRKFYGEEAWKQTAGRVVDRANAILRPAGLRLHVQGHQAWTSPDEIDDLSRLLAAMAQHPNPVPRSIRLGFTGQTQLAVAWNAEMEDIGRAYMPGDEVLIADQAVAPGHDPAWDVADEGVALAHEVLHALGIPHLDEPDHLMAATKRGTVHAMSLASIELARAAAAARYTHWDPLAALAALSEAADAHLGALNNKLDFITDNLAWGPGFPEPGTLEPRQLSAMTNVAIGRYYLKLSAESPNQAARLHASARVHAESALAQEPSWREARTLQKQIQAAARSSRSSTSASERPPTGARAPGGPLLTCPLDVEPQTCD